MYINAYVAISHFNPRSPHGERPRAGDERGGGKAFQSTLPARGATAVAALMIAVNGISIHAPRTGSDRRSHQRRTSRRRFQSTLPARGATQRRTSRRRKQRFQSTLPARGATRRPNIVLCAKPDISIHAPRTGSDALEKIGTKPADSFQSTLPARGATRHDGRRRTSAAAFQSTLPARGATCTLADVVRGTAISIHAPRTGSDFLPPRGRLVHTDFNPRSPHGERPNGQR